MIERLSAEVQLLEFVVIDPESLPVSTSGHAPRCKVPGVTYGFGTSGPVYSFKLLAWTTLTGKIAKYEIHSANLDDFTVSFIMNCYWPAQVGQGRSGVSGQASSGR